MGEVSPTADAPRNVLVYVASDLVRDGLTKLPFVWALRNAYPGAQITWLAGKGKSAYAHALAPLVRGLLNEVIEDSGTGRRWTEALRRPLGGTGLEGRHFDLILDTQRRLGTSLLLRRVPHGIFVSGAGRFVLSDRRPADRRAKPPSKVRRLLDLLELASGRPADIAGAPPTDLRHDALARALLPAGPRYIGFAPGASGTDKCWPLEAYLDLAEREQARGRVPVFLLGPEESAWAPAIAERLPEARLPLQAEAVARGGPSALITIALAKRLAAAVANDSGAGHMLAAANCPLVSLFGPTAPEKSAPLARHARVLRAQDHGGEDLGLIPAAAVAGALDAVMGQAAEAGDAKRPSWPAEREDTDREDEGEPPPRALRSGTERRLFGGEVR